MVYFSIYPILWDAALPAHSDLGSYLPSLDLAFGMILLYRPSGSLRFWVIFALTGFCLWDDSFRFTIYPILWDAALPAHSDLGSYLPSLDLAFGMILLYRPLDSKVKT
jgi:hypothetical protein